MYFDDFVGKNLGGGAFIREEAFVYWSKYNILPLMINRQAFR